LVARTDYIECQFHRFDSDKKSRCLFCDINLKQYPNGCPSCIDLPTVSALLDEDAKKSREIYRKEIREMLAAGQASLALGAGISIPMRMPNWLGLISKMAGYAQQYVDYSDDTLKYSEDIRYLRTVLEQELATGNLTLFNGVNVLESGQYIEQALHRVAAGESVQALLKEKLSIIIEQSLTPAQWIDEKWKKSYPTLGHPKDHQVLAAEHNSLCAVAYLLCADHGFRRAMTYNFDTLVQEFLIDIFKVSPNEIFTHPGAWSDCPRENVSDPIDIYHVHGCIPRRVSLQKPSCAFPRESDQIILTESSYYNTEQAWAYNWQNSIQSYYLNRDSCVFVGFSADDYNFRRILKHLQVGTHPKHYLILTIDNVAKETWAAVCHRHLFSNTSQKDIQKEALHLLKIQLDMKSEYWKNKNFYPIWVTVNDIPKFLLSLV